MSGERNSVDITKKLATSTRDKSSIADWRYGESPRSRERFDQDGEASIITARSVVAPDHAHVEGEHRRAGDGDDREPTTDTGPVEVVEDQ
jgi:hypothetical protein